MTTRRDRRRPVENLLGLAVLSYLTRQPMHAYELHRQLKANDAAETFKLSYGALYSVVRQLLRAGLISESETGRTGSLPKHTKYRLSDAGRRELSDWLRELVAEPRHEYPAFAAALSLIAVLPPDDVAALLRHRVTKVVEQRRAVAEQQAGAVDAGVARLFLVEDDYRLALMDAELDFVRGLLERIANDDWSGPWREHHAAGRRTGGE